MICFVLRKKRPYKVDTIIIKLRLHWECPSVRLVVNFESDRRFLQISKNIKLWILRLLIEVLIKKKSSIRLKISVPTICRINFKKIHLSLALGWYHKEMPDAAKEPGSWGFRFKLYVLSGCLVTVHKRTFWTNLNVYHIFLLNTIRQ